MPSRTFRPVSLLHNSFVVQGDPWSLILDESYELYARSTNQVKYKAQFVLLYQLGNKHELEESRGDQIPTFLGYFDPSVRYWDIGSNDSIGRATLCEVRSWIENYMTYRFVEVSINDYLTSLLVALLIYIGLSDGSMQASFPDDCIVRR
ncbi:uncharacterized protein FPRO_05886 [Fusarium proliferatum ET1]|uniref:Uncharacterized protein n=1 Tax=Fusarium proliferatum (strain ET1) TaxID=1227346 RepID=A0A1L7VF86_FUSPR|nr:uncharacterized protein FPRO_05886 [Fusarium proliferatum ET1]CZR38922.1 uncharacterized protein FPRO_05886 [Fusarium proliferatum ET1]